ncbi:toprim domain-containing protein [Nitrospinae bacterium AH_259_B05_G02_I21]|nr:toprim domain-containing protein [Nitrospinae bacterium AH_259_B05_G02_I21]
MRLGRELTGAADIAAALKGHLSGRGWRAHCPVHEDQTPSLHIAEGKNGRLLLKCFAGCSWGALRDALMARGLFPSEVRNVPDAEQQARWSDKRKAEELARVGAARRLWGQAVPITPDSPAGRYLSRRRLPGPWPVTLRFLPRAWHPTGRTFPALIAAATRWPDRVPVAVQLTALTPDGQKAMVDPVRWTRGVLRGAAVRLAPWGEGEAIILTEGTEDGLAARIVPASTPWAVLGVGNARDVVVPDGAEVVLALDGDEAGRRSAEVAAQAMHARGHRVRVAILPEGKDLDDLLRGDAAGDGP